MTDIQAPPPQAPPPSGPLSLVQRIEALEQLAQDIQDMMTRDRRWMDDLRGRIGL